MLRLDPAHPPLWRNATSLQFGIDAAALLDDPQPWEQRVIAALDDGLTEPALIGMARSAGVDAGSLDALLADLSPVIRRVPPRPRIAIDVDGVPAPLADMIVDALERAGADVARAGSQAAPGRPTVLVALQLVAPHRAAALMSRDTPHLPLVLNAAGAEIGPYIEPGTTGCLSCGALHARDRDPHWPLLASQLLGRPFAPDPDVAVEAARAALQLLTAKETSPSRSLLLRAASPQREWRRHAPHAECRCRSLGGSATESAPPVPVRATSSSTAFARPA